MAWQRVTRDNDVYTALELLRMGQDVRSGRAYRGKKCERLEDLPDNWTAMIFLYEVPA